MRRPPHLGLFLAAALVLHGAVGAAWLLRPPRPEATVPPAPRATQTASEPAWTLSAESQRRAIEAARKVHERAVPPVPAVKKPLPRGTVVDLPPDAQQRPPPEDSAFLAEHNSRADKETRSRHSSQTFKEARNEPMAGPDRPETHAAQARAAAAAKPQAQAPDAAAGGGAAHRPIRRQASSEAARDRLRLPERPLGATARNHDARPEGRQEPLQLHLGPVGPDVAVGTGRGNVAGPGAGSGAKAVGHPALTMAQLVPDVATLSRMGGGPKNDVGLDVPEGEGTFLNAREFKYASFFNRIKEQISNHWRPLPEYQRRDPSGHIYGSQNRMTVLTIALDAQGALEKLEVAQTSGIDFLDEEGLRAIRAAAPFVHPPRGLLENGERIVFNFAFAIDVSGSGYRGLP